MWVMIYKFLQHPHRSYVIMNVHSFYKGVGLTLNTYAYLKNEIQIISNEISLLYKRQDELNKQLQKLCLQENKITLNNVEYSGIIHDFEYCNGCKKTMLLS
jgi:hypothetical protein